MEEKLIKLKKLIVENNFIEIHEMFLEEITVLQNNLTSEDYRSNVELNKRNILKAINDYENHISSLLDLIIL